MFIARQPIFNRRMEIYGYELLFRSDTGTEKFDNTPSAAATATVLDGLFEQGIERIVGNAKAFINFDYDFLMSDMMELINPDTLVIEVLETVEADPNLIKRIQYLRNKGYKIALDDFKNNLDSYPAVPVTDMIKYDIMLTPLDTIKGDVKQALASKKIILAEKIETEDEFGQALAMGFHLFQGYFFSKPKIIGNSVMRKTSPVSYANILHELNREEPSYDILTGIIESDVSLAYRMMRVLSHKKEESRFDSIKKALVRMGLKELERWITILMLQDITQDKPVELMRLSLVRSRFSEYAAGHSPLFRQRKKEVYMMCLFSLLDAILDVPIAEALDGIPVSEDVHNALVHNQGSLQPVYAMILAYERGEWSEVSRIAKDIQIDAEILNEGYIAAIEWASKVVALFEM